MIRILILLFAIVFISNDLCAQRYATRNGVVRLTYNHPTWGSLETVNRQVNVGLDVETGEIRMQILMLSFRFARGFHQEVFNDYFVQYSQYANARFEGYVTNIDQIDFERGGIYTVDVRGDLTLRNFTNPISTTAEFMVTRDNFQGEALFDIYIKDFMHMTHPSSAYWPDNIRISMDVNMRRL